MKTRCAELRITFSFLTLALIECSGPVPSTPPPNRSDARLKRCTELAAAGYANCVTDQISKGIPQEQVDAVCSAIARAFRDKCIRNGGR